VTGIDADPNAEPTVTCTISATNPSAVDVVFEGYLDRSLNDPDPAGSADRSGKTRFCLVGDFDGWGSRSYCYDWAPDPKKLTFWNVPIRTPTSSSRINFVKDNGAGAQQWIDDQRIVASGHCANVPGLNLVTQ
jgi:hypothetical protein